MKRSAAFTVLSAMLAFAAHAQASDAQTSATAGSTRFQGNGTAAATARYEGDQGFARTQSRSGPVSVARGVAVGFDEDGLSLSVSQAVAPRSGPALATTFNLSIGADGRVSGSTGLALASGPISRSATAGGGSGTGPFSPSAVAQASGQSDPHGRVIVRTHADDFQPRRVPAVRPARYAPPARVVRVARPGW